MEIHELPLQQLTEAPWNPNRMDAVQQGKLRESVGRYGLVTNLVVRPIARDRYEVLSGNQRLEVLRELGYATVPCVVVDLGEARARLLAQALNRVQGEDDLGLKAELIRRVLEEIPQEEVLGLLPETAESLSALASLGQQDMAEYLKNWEQGQSARLKHYSFQFMPNQVETIEEALARVMPEARAGVGDSPNLRGRALYLICQRFLKEEQAS